MGGQRDIADVARLGVRSHRSSTLGTYALFELCLEILAFILSTLYYYYS